MNKIGHSQLDYNNVIAISKYKEKVSLPSSTKKKIESSRRAVESIIKNKDVVYGITTGFGAFKNTIISEEEVSQLQKNLILSHAVGVGEPFKEEIVRGMIFLIINYLSKGYSGVRTEVVETLIAMLNKG
ncbi:aromatic amino acid lyase, partial [Candidatus Microgenomates bacterium]|nr:aromatic amino acid lyase [Candidatus Microgenomates bacterium]